MGCHLHVAEHKNCLCGANEQHLTASHQKASTQDLWLVKGLMDAGVRVADAFRALTRQDG